MQLIGTSCNESTHTDTHTHKKRTVKGKYRKIISSRKFSNYKTGSYWSREREKKYICFTERLFSLASNTNKGRNHVVIKAVNPNLGK